MYFVMYSMVYFLLLSGCALPCVNAYYAVLDVQAQLLGALGFTSSEMKTARPAQKKVESEEVVRKPGLRCCSFGGLKTHKMFISRRRCSRILISCCVAFTVSEEDIQRFSHCWGPGGCMHKMCFRRISGLRLSTRIPTSSRCAVCRMR